MAADTTAARPRIDAYEFTRRNERLSGATPIAQLPRLAEATADGGGQLQWTLRGHTTVESGVRHDWLQLDAAGVLNLPCARCMEPVAVPLAIDRLFKLEPDEAAAERAPLDEDRFDSIVGSRSLDVLQLLEDEALLALPLGERHADCTLPMVPGQNGASEAADSGPARPNPFAALATLKPQRNKS